MADRGRERGQRDQHRHAVQVVRVVHHGQHLRARRRARVGAPPPTLHGSLLMLRYSNAALQRRAQPAAGGRVSCPRRHADQAQGPALGQVGVQRVPGKQS